MTVSRKRVKFSEIYTRQKEHKEIPTAKKTQYI